MAQVRITAKPFRVPALPLLPKYFGEPLDARFEMRTVKQLDDVVARAKPAAT